MQLAADSRGGAQADVAIEAGEDRQYGVAIERSPGGGAVGGVDGVHGAAGRSIYEDSGCAELKL